MAASALISFGARKWSWVWGHGSFLSRTQTLHRLEANVTMTTIYMAKMEKRDLMGGKMLAPVTKIYGEFYACVLSGSPTPAPPTQPWVCV